jgi:hypothetical protein
MPAGMHRDARREVAQPATQLRLIIGGAALDTFDRCSCIGTMTIPETFKRATTGPAEPDSARMRAFRRRATGSECFRKPRLHLLRRSNDISKGVHRQKENQEKYSTTRCWSA